MAFITYRFADGHSEGVEGTEEFAAEYAEMEHRDALIERKETRRHQSLDKSLEHGFDVPDLRKRFGGNREEGVVRRNTESAT